MRILMTNCVLDTATGTVAYVKDLALALKKRGHDVAVYTTLLGMVGKELQNLGVPVVLSLKKLPFYPDIIHGNHYHETVEAIRFFPITPAIYVCHDRLSVQSRTPTFSNIIKYVAVDENCLERLLLEGKIPRHKTVVVYNFVNLDRFKPRCALPEKPHRAVVFSNYASQKTYLPPIQKACDKFGISLDVIGSNIGRYNHIPEKILGNYDIVFAKAKCAIEAMAIGCAVICCDYRGLGGMVSVENFENMRRYNFGMKILNLPFDENLISNHIAKYNPVDASLVTNLIRDQASLDHFVVEMENLYQEVVSEPLEKLTDEIAWRDFDKTSVRRYVKKLVRRIFTYFPLSKKCYLGLRHALQKKPS